MEMQNSALVNAAILFQNLEMILKNISAVGSVTAKAFACGTTGTSAGCTNSTAGTTICYCSGDNCNNSGSTFEAFIALIITSIALSFKMI